MQRPPRDPTERLLSRFVVIRTVYVGVLMSIVAIALFLLTAPPGTASEGLGAAGPAGIAQAQTLAVTSVAFFQIFYLLTCRTLTEPVRTIGYTSNPAIFAGIGILLILHAGFVHLPFMQALFRTEHLTLTQRAVAAAAGAVIAPVVSIEKWWRRRPSSPGTAGPTKREVPDGRHI